VASARAIYDLRRWLLHTPTSTGCLPESTLSVRGQNADAGIASTIVPLHCMAVGCFLDTMLSPCSPHLHSLSCAEEVRSPSADLRVVFPMRQSFAHDLHRIDRSAAPIGACSLAVCHHPISSSIL